MRTFGILFILLLSLSSITAKADVCICQYPKEDAKHGAGYKGEIFFYKMGCALWLIGQKKCRKRKIRDINDSLMSFLDDKLRSNETVKLGYVGHWGSSTGMVEYIKDIVKPIMDRYGNSVEVENTACYPMDNARKVYDHISNYVLETGNYIKVKGAQITSIGMWDKLSIRFRKADLMATADTRTGKVSYPSCGEYLGKRCTGFQIREKGYCSNYRGETTELVCNYKSGKPKRNKKGNIRTLQAKTWQYAK